VYGVFEGYRVYQGEEAKWGAMGAKQSVGRAVGYGHKINQTNKPEPCQKAACVICVPVLVCVCGCVGEGVLSVRHEQQGRTSGWGQWALFGWRRSLVFKVSISLNLNSFSCVQTKNI